MSIHTLPLFHFILPLKSLSYSLPLPNIPQNPSCPFNISLFHTNLPNSTHPRIKRISLFLSLLILPFMTATPTIVSTTLKPAPDIRISGSKSTQDLACRCQRSAEENDNTDHCAIETHYLHVGCYFCSGTACTYCGGETGNDRWLRVVAYSKRASNVSQSRLKTSCPLHRKDAYGPFQGRVRLRSLKPSSLKRTSLPCSYI